MVFDALVSDQDSLSFPSLAPIGANGTRPTISGPAKKAARQGTTDATYFEPGSWWTRPLRRWTVGVHGPRRGTSTCRPGSGRNRMGDGPEKRKAHRSIPAGWKLLPGVGEGVRTLDLRSHGPSLCQLSYTHHEKPRADSIPSSRYQATSPAQHPADSTTMPWLRHALATSCCHRP